MRKTMYKNILLITSCFLMLSADVFAGKDQDEEDWREAEKEIGQVRYPDSFFTALEDSLGAGGNSNLRVMETPSFLKGEKLVFKGGWGFLKAGWAILESKTEKNDSILLLTGKALTNKFVSVFFNVRDYVLSTVDARGFYPYYFEQHLHEKKYKADKWTLYDHVNSRVFGHDEEGPQEASQFTHNYISLLYYLRMQELTPGKDISLPCYVHNKNYSILFRVGEREKIDVEAGTFQCLKVTPRLVGEGRGFTKKDKMTIWMTDDKYHMPVFIKAKAALGYLRAELMYYKR